MKVFLLGSDVCEKYVVVGEAVRPGRRPNVGLSGRRKAQQPQDRIRDSVQDPAPPLERPWVYLVDLVEIRKHELGVWDPVALPGWKEPLVQALCR